MLTHHVQTDAGAACNYYRQGDYYLAEDQRRMQWGGQLAERLGLAGEPTAEQFERLCHNRHPTGEGPLTPRTNADRAALIDFTFSAPKPVSVLWAATRDERIVDAFHAAVDETMKEAEALAQTRVRKGGANFDRDTGNLLWNRITEFSGRPATDDLRPDPQIHAHCTVFPATHDPEENRLKAVQFREIFRHLPYLQAGFHARLSKNMAGLGFTITRDGHEPWQWGIQGIERATVEKFSRRQAEIGELREKLGLPDTADVRQVLALTTRQHKQESLGPDELHGYWLGRLSPAELTGLHGAVAAARLGDARRQHPTAREALDFACEHHFEADAVVPERTLLATALAHGIGGVTPEQARAELANSGLIRATLDGQKIVTSKELLAEEREIVAFARDSRGTRAPLAAGQRVERDYLSDSQQAAVRHVWQSTGNVTMVWGAAGTGKTELAKEAIAGIERAGKKVMVLAPSADASRGTLREAGFAHADTVAAFLQSDKLQGQYQGGVLWLDEAGMLGHKDALRLTRAAKENDMRIVAVGDPGQHGSVGRGALLSLWKNEAGVTPAEVKEIRRQSGAYREAATLLSGGKSTEALEKLDALGWVREVPDAERPAAVAAEYADSLKTHAPKDVLIVSPTNREAAEISQAVRERLKQDGRLGESRTLTRLAPVHLSEAEKKLPDRYRPGDVLQFHQRAKGHRAGERVTVGPLAPPPLGQSEKYSAYRPEPIDIAPGERLRLTANGTSLDGHRLNNGAVYGVRGFDAAGNVELENGWRLPPTWGHWQHAYVQTSWSSQSKTVQKVILSQSAQSAGASSREQLYVSLTRSRKEAVIFCDSKQNLAELAARSEQKRTAHEAARAAAAAHAGTASDFARRRRRFAQFVNRSREHLRERSRDRATQTARAADDRARGQAQAR